MTRGVAIFVGVWFFPRLLHVAPLCFNCQHGGQVSTTQGARNRYVSIEYGHRILESREGNIECHASQGRFWFRQRYPHNDQSTFSSVFTWLLKLKRT